MKSLLVFALLGLVFSTSIAFPSAEVEDALESSELREKENDFDPEKTEILSDEDLDEDEDEDNDDPDMNDEEEEEDDEEENDDDDDDDDDPEEEEEDEAGLVESKDSQSDPRWNIFRRYRRRRRYGYRRRRYGYRRRRYGRRRYFPRNRKG